MYQQYLNELHTSIANLSAEDLKELLNDDDKLEERVSAVLNSLETEKAAILGENRSKAEENLGKEPEIIELRGKISDLSTEGKELCASIQQKLSEFKNKSGIMNQDTALAILQTAAAQSEEESDKLVKGFLDNELVLENFLEQFLMLRRTMHLRKLRAEKISEMIKAENGLSSHVSPSSRFFNVPYPMGPMPMPMPRHPY